MTRWNVIELTASILTIAALTVGSTTLAGAGLYLAALVFWFWLTVGKELWGLMPLNVASTVVSLVNVWRALA